MPRAQRIPRRRGYQHYLLRDIEEHRLSFVRGLLRFIYGRYTSRAEFWSVLEPLFFHHPLGQASRPPEEKEEEILSTYSVEHLRKLQKWCRTDFERTVERLRKGERLTVPRSQVHIIKTKAPGGEEIFWTGPSIPRVRSVRDMQLELDGLLLWSLSHLKAKAILRCQKCEKYFLRSDQREALWCSQVCRYQAINERRRQKGGRGQRIRKRG